MGDSVRIQDETTESSAWFFNPFPNKPWFLSVCSTSVLKTLWEKEKLLERNNFSFSYGLYYLAEELSFRMEDSKTSHFGKELTCLAYSTIRWDLGLTSHPKDYSITCIQRPLKGSNESGLLQEVVF